MIGATYKDNSRPSGRCHLVSWINILESSTIRIATIITDEEIELLLANIPYASWLLSFLLSMCFDGFSSDVVEPIL